MPGVPSFFFCTVKTKNYFLLGTVCAFATEYLALIDCNYTIELYAAVRRTSMYLHIPVMYLCCCSVCCYTAVVAVAVRHRVPDGEICCCGSLHLIPVFSFSSSFKHDLLLMYVPLGSTLSHLKSRFIYDYLLRIIHPR